MKITLKLLATYEKLLPPGSSGSACEIDIHANATPEEILSQYGVPLDGSSVILVNGRSPAKNCNTLQKGDVLCAFPVATGG